MHYFNRCFGTYSRYQEILDKNKKEQNAYMVAVRYSQIEVMEELEKYSAITTDEKILKSRDKDENTAFLIACTYANLATVVYLFEKYINSQSSVDQKNKWEQNAYLWACVIKYCD